jgi:hypothetical protein
VPSLQSVPQRSLHRACHQGLRPWPRPRPRHLIPAATGCACCLLPHSGRRKREERRNMSDFQLIRNSVSWPVIHIHHTTEQSTTSYKKESREILAWLQVQDLPFTLSL